MLLEIYNFIKQLFVEQTTPVEVLIIILVCIAGGMIISFILYAFFVLAIWSMRFRKKVTLRYVLFPSNKHVKEHLGKYLLSGLTTLIVVSTLVTKHDLIDAVKNYKWKASDIEQIEEVLPMLSNSSIINDLDGQVAATLLQPLIDVGDSRSAKVLTTIILRFVKQEKRAPFILRFLTEGEYLVWLCIVLSVVYILFLTSDRFSRIRADSESSEETQYGKTARSLLLLVTCIGILLAAPNLAREYNEAIDGLPIGPSVGSCGSAAYRGETVIVADISKDPLWKDYRELGARFGLRACWSVPILSESDHVLGTLAIYHTEVYEPTAAELDISMKSAALARVAIEHAKALDTLQDREAALRQSHAKVQDLAGRLIAAQEEERRRLSRELHDGLNQHLATLSFEIGFLRSQLPEENTDMRERLRALQTRAAQAIDDARHRSRELPPASLEHLGLVSALRTHCFEIEKQEEIRVKLTLVKVPENIPREVALCLYRVAQEALRNAVKHSGAPEVRVTLTGADGSLELYVADSGSGFDTEQIRGGLGLVSMEERVRLLGGSVCVTSQPRLGTRLEIRVPVSDSEPFEDRSVEKHRA